ncbi:MAG: signal peptide peptidase SppA [Alistipes sp.]|jgi:protease-4|nr:signal peptide peptidase SppA [Alistipes sp.]
MNFFKTFLAALLAIVVGFGAMVIMWTLVMVGMMASLGSSFGGSMPAPVMGESVLRLDMGTVTDAPSGSPFGGFDFATMSSTPGVSLLQAVRAIQSATTDDRIEGIYINFDENTSISLTGLEELRAELVKFKESGKFIVAYQESWAQIGYWFASVADKVYANPAGGLQWQGLSTQMMFYKGLLDKLDIEPIVVRHGQFKSAVEPFILDGMSPENRLQYETLFGSIWNVMVSDIAASRGITVDELQRMANELTIDSPQAAVDNKMIDGTMYEDQVLADMGSRMKETTEEPKIVSFGDYAAQVFDESKSDNEIAIVYAEGDIVSGSGSQGQIGSASLVEKIKEVREDDDIKAVVLRINSPGGSALASEVMWRELELLKAEKPLVVSMGSMAASGGYYIAAPGDAIMANRTTLTGSIGVFGLFANLSDALKTNAGITVDVVNTNRYSDLGTMLHSPSEAEMAYLQKSVEDVYATFTGHVAAGRNMTVEAVDNIGQGRVWSGVNALEIGLIDGFGGLVDAVALAADRVGVADDFRVREVMDTPTGLEALFGGLGATVRNYVMQDELGAAFEEYEHLRQMLDEKGVQARMPYAIDIR